MLLFAPAFIANVKNGNSQPGSAELSSLSWRFQQGCWAPAHLPKRNGEPLENTGAWLRTIPFGIRVMHGGGISAGSSFRLALPPPSAAPALVAPPPCRGRRLRALPSPPGSSSLLPSSHGSASQSAPEQKLRQNTNKNKKEIAPPAPQHHPQTELPPSRAPRPGATGGSAKSAPVLPACFRVILICLNFETKLLSKGNFHCCCSPAPEGAGLLPRLGLPFQCCCKLTPALPAFSPSRLSPSPLKNTAIF